jgi:TonB family protein
LISARDPSSRLTIAVLASVGIHVGLLAVLPALRLQGGEPTPLVRVSFLASAGTRGGGTGAAAPVPEGRAAEPSGVVEAYAPKAVPVEKKRVAARPKRPAPSTSPKSPVQVDAAPPSDEAAAKAAEIASAAGPTSNDGAAGGPSSTGRGGAGEGQGVGIGSGSGRGGGGDLRVACEYCPAPRYPRTAVARKAEGVVQVGFTVMADGRVSEVQVRSSSGDHELDRAAVDVARRSRFRLAAPVADAARGYLEYQFQLARRGNT